MRDKQLDQHLLGLTAPWTVSEVRLDMKTQETHVRVEHPRGTKFCFPTCQKQLSCYDHGDERQWWHLASCQFKTMLNARVPRVSCSEHGVKSIIVQYAEPHSRLMILTNGFADGINSKIMSLNSRAGGCRNIENFKKAIFSDCG